MNLGVISDIHGNLAALEAVLLQFDQEHDVDAIACAGDIVGPLGWPDETVTRVQSVAEYAVLGNHDAYVHPDYSYTPTHPVQKQEHRIVTQSLTAESVEWIQNLPEVVEISSDVVLGHANPFVENSCGFPADEYVDKRDWTSFASEHMAGELVIIGHTHDQGFQNMSKFDGLNGAILNPGSVGQPWDSQARYAVVDTETHEAELHRTTYDKGRAARRFDEIGLKESDEP